MSGTTSCSCTQPNTTPSYHDKLKKLYQDEIGLACLDGYCPDVVLRCGHEANRAFMEMWSEQMHRYEYQQIIPLPCPTCRDPITAIFSAHYSTSSHDKESTMFSCELLSKIADILNREIVAKAQATGESGESYIDTLTETQCKAILDQIANEMRDAKGNPLTIPNFYMHLDTDSVCTADKSASRGDDETVCPICTRNFEKRTPAYLLQRILDILHNTSVDTSSISNIIVRAPLHEQTSYPPAAYDTSSEF